MYVSNNSPHFMALSRKQQRQRQLSQTDLASAGRSK